MRIALYFNSIQVTGEVVEMLIMSASFLCLFGISEWLYIKRGVKSEVTRKISHIGTGILTLLFPIVLDNHWEVLILCTSFLILLTLSIKFKFLKGINDVDRTTYGSVLYPIAVYLVYLAYSQTGDLNHFYSPILILAISDPLAALIGKKLPWIPYSVGSERKTLSGSLAFALSAAIISIVLLESGGATWGLSTALTVLSVAVFSAFVEAISRKGWDNLWIPIAVLSVYWISLLL